MECQNVGCTRNAAVGGMLCQPCRDAIDAMKPIRGPRFWPCKIGTIPSLVIIKSGKSPKRVRQKIMVRNAESGSKFFQVRITKIDQIDFEGDKPYFFAEKM